MNAYCPCERGQTAARWNTFGVVIPPTLAAYIAPDCRSCDPVTGLLRNNTGESTMLDLQAIRARHMNPERVAMRTYYEGHIEVDLAALVEECERLYRERMMLSNYFENRSISFKKGDLVDLVMQRENDNRAAVLARAAQFLEDHDHSAAAAALLSGGL